MQLREGRMVPDPAWTQRVWGEQPQPQAADTSLSSAAHPPDVWTHLGRRGWELCYG